MLSKDTPIQTAQATEETWKPVVGYEGVYSVSNSGRVRRDLAGRGARAGYILANKCAKNGYPRVGLVFNGIQETRHCHSLVAEAFIGPLLPGQCVNHIDGDKTNNRISNLEYVPYSENNFHAFREGLKFPSPPSKGERNGSAKLTAEQVLEIRNSHDSNAACGRRYGISRTHIRRIRMGRNWREIA